MRLTHYTDYALRVLMYVGLKDRTRTELATITEIAGAYGISRNHLVKIVHDLGGRGYLYTLRGKHGGIRLAKPAAEINIGTLVRELEEDMRLVECFGDTTVNGCCIAPATGSSGSRFDAQASTVARAAFSETGASRSVPKTTACSKRSWRPSGKRQQARSR